MGQDMQHPPSISITDYELEAIHKFVYLGSTTADSLSLETEINRCPGKAASTLSQPTQRVWSNSKLTEHSKVRVYKPRTLSILLYSSESCTLHLKQDRKLNSFHLCCLWRIFDISWRDRAPNSTAPERAGITLLEPRCLL